MIWNVWNGENLLGIVNEETQPKAWKAALAWFTPANKHPKPTRVTPIERPRR